MEPDETARLLFLAELKREIQAVRRDFFAIIDGLRIDDMDNVDQLNSILQDEDLARKFQLFQHNRATKIRKDILDTTNNIERSLLKFLENIDINIKEGVEFRALIK